MSSRMFAVQVLLETHFAPILLVLRRLFVGYPYRKIALTQNKFALVDPEDYAELARHKWCAARQGRSFYAVRSEAGRQLRMHRVILHAPAGQVVDHMDHSGLNNLKRNLRPCTPAQNAHNQRPQKGRSSQYRGVCWHKGEQKWYSRIQNQGRQQSLGLFDDERDAARARDAAAKALHGEFAFLNLPPKPSLLAALKRLLAHRCFQRAPVVGRVGVNERKSGAAVRWRHHKPACLICLTFGTFRHSVWPCIRCRVRRYSVLSAVRRMSQGLWANWNSSGTNATCRDPSVCDKPSYASLKRDL